MTLRLLGSAVMLVGLLCVPLLKAEAQHEPLAAAIRALEPRVVPETDRETVANQVGRDISARLKAANQKSSAEWAAIREANEWKRFRAEKIRLLRESFGKPVGDMLGKALAPGPGEPRTLRVGPALEGDGFRVEKIIYESPAHLWITASLYLPAAPRDSMPGLIISHSHHAPKWSGELQDMGQTWARAGCVVLVPDHLGHGERRQHPFVTAADFPQPFKVDRQDYYFRHELGLQMQFAGASLPGWMASDLIVGVNVLLAQKGVDEKRIILLGGVAGGGDPAALAAALDERIACAVIFNFGGPQPESRFPLPADAETSFGYAGSGSWESTRNLRRSAADGFLPWAIVGSIAPRKLIYGHEFSWDREHDPVWRRLEKIWNFYGAGENLAVAHGRGTLRGEPPAASHCGHIGLVHRAMIHPQFESWFGIKVKPENEYSQRRSAAELTCMNASIAQEIKPPLLREVLLAERQRLSTTNLGPEKQRANLQARWRAGLGNIKPLGEPAVRAVGETNLLAGGAREQKFLITTESEIVAPVLLLLPPEQAGAKFPVVLALAQPGKAALLRARANEVAKLLSAGVAVCLPDVRGLGEAGDDQDRGPNGAMTSYSSSELMLGGTMLGAQLRDARQIISWLRTRPEINAERVALWGDSLVSPLEPTSNFQMPRRVDGRPPEAEPWGALLVDLAALFDERICAVYSRGGWDNFDSLYATPFVYVPHDLVPIDLSGSLNISELRLFLSSSSRPEWPGPRYRAESLVDGCNRPVGGGKPIPEASTALLELLAQLDKKR